jgi:hypothetical protein
MITRHVNNVERYYGSRCRLSEYVAWPAMTVPRVGAAQVIAVLSCPLPLSLVATALAHITGVCPSGAAGRQ